MIKYLYDQHMHSSFSRDSEEDLHSYFKEASKLGIEYVCTCEHFDYLTVVDGTTWEADYDKLIELHKELKRDFPSVTPLLGVELGYKPSSLNAIIELVNKYPFDIVQLSIHDNDKWDYYFPNAFDNELGIIDSMNEYFDLMIEGMNVFNNYDVLSHIDFGFKTVKMLDKSYSFSLFENRIKEVMKLCIARNKAFEINTKVQEVIASIDGNDNHINYLLRLYKECGGNKLTLSSDAHSVSRYRSSFTKYIKIIKENGFDELSYYIKRIEHIFKI